MLRQFNEMVDVSFVFEELIEVLLNANNLNLRYVNHALSQLGTQRAVSAIMLFTWICMNMKELFT